MADPKRDRASERGIPDSLLIGALLFLLGLTLLAWSATGLAGLFAHGAWPENVTFIRTPLAVRQLFEEPQNLIAAWPHTPEDELSGYGLFWGIFISELLIVLVATVFTIGTVARYRLVRARRAASSHEAADDPPADAAGRRSGQHPKETGRYGTQGAGPAEAIPGPRTAHPAPAAPASSAPAASPAQPTADPTAAAPLPADPGAYFTAIYPTAQAPQPDAASPTRAMQQPSPGAEPYAHGFGAPAASPSLSPQAAPATETVASGGAAASGMPASNTGAVPIPLAYGASTQSAAVPSQRAALWSGTAEPPRVLYGPAATRHEAALHAILEATGPVLVTSSDAALWAESAGTRAKLGPVHVFDPGHLLDTPARLRWNPASGCEAREVAATRSAALLAPVRPASLIDSATADAAETLLRCWLHAAAVDGRPFRQVHRWAQGNSAHEPVRILRTNPKAISGMAGELESTLTAHPERRDLAQELTARALGALSSIHIRDACNANRADALALESFIGEGGTLYVAGEALENPRTQPGAMPLLTALVANVVERGRRMAERSSPGRLDPPLTLVLDDIAAVAPFPALPELVTGGVAQGLPTLALMRSPEQARARWPRTHNSLVTG
ncbi:hypothetical protein [Streptomyces zagrosensis]|uniref:Type VI secretion protein n=1 Tax=Streptomyces zagrosensis TaxID=1042984 RepID=A0A7W9QH96_9ACTN|nr:hypothetical protein [Streptomyces zagrosensis]MBB5940131.1 hypothetical protein [Streptomyces zagrosensis]